MLWRSVSCCQYRKKFDFFFIYPKIYSHANDSQTVESPILHQHHDWSYFSLQRCVRIWRDVPAARARLLPPCGEHCDFRLAAGGPHGCPAYLQGPHCHRHSGRGGRNRRLRPLYRSQPAEVSSSDWCYCFCCDFLKICNENHKIRGILLLFIKCLYKCKRIQEQQRFQ